MRALSGHVTLLIGGARAGKSRIAQALAAAAGERVVFIATATAGDEEMAGRIARHQADRPAHWTTVEAPLDPARALDATHVDAVILDCVTLWVTNRLLAAAGPDAAVDPDPLARALATDAADFVEVARASAGVVAIVTNEVGLGLVPEYPLGRAFRDVLGAVNAHLATLVDHVVLVVAGQQLTIKGGPRGHTA